MIGYRTGIGPLSRGYRGRRLGALLGGGGSSDEPVAETHTGIAALAETSYPSSLDGYSFGYRFTVGDQPITVHALRCYTPTADPRNLRLWSLDGTLLASAAVQSAADQWAEAQIEPIGFAAGAEGIVMVSGPTYHRAEIAHFTPGPNLTIAEGRNSSSDTDTSFPGGTHSRDMYGYPDIVFTLA